MKNAVAEWVVNAVSPFAAVDQKRFKEMLLAINPMLRVTTREAVCCKILENHSKLRYCQFLFIQSMAQYVSLICDGWSPRIYRGYMAFFIYWIHNDWTLYSFEFCLL